MDITPYVEQLRLDLQNAADVGDDQGRAAASRLLIALDPATRMVLMDALSQAAAEITTELPAGSVEVRLAGRSLDFVVEIPLPDEPAVEPFHATAPEPETDDDGALARVTLRLPESVKKQAEERAAESGQSLNTWLVNAVRAATAAPPAPPGPGVPPLPPPPGGMFSAAGRRRASGWL
jgi:HicB family